MRVEVLDPRWSRRWRPTSCRRRCEGRACSSAGPARQVPAVAASATRSTCSAPADDRRAAARPAPEPLHVRVVACAFAAAGGWRSSIRGASAPASCCSASRRWRRSSPRGSASSRCDADFTARAPARARPRPPRADQGVPARPAPRRRRRQHLRRRGAVPRRHPPAAARRAPDAPRSTRCCATRSSTRCRPGSTRAARRSTTSATSTACAAASRTVPRAPARGRAVRALRHDDPQARRRRARHVRLRDAASRDRDCAAAHAGGGRAPRHAAAALGGEQVLQPAVVGGRCTSL